MYNVASLCKFTSVAQPVPHMGANSAFLTNLLNYNITSNSVR